jgi:hypothetical protein
MDSRPDEPIPVGLGPDEDEIPPEDLPDMPDPLELPDVPDDGELVDPYDE